MLNLLGEYHCRIDAKGRVSFPAKLRKQLDRVLHEGLVVNRDIFEGCLVLYPKPEWDKVNAEMGQLSRYDRQHQLFQRKFMKGATLVELDGSGRMLLPSALLGHAGLEAGKAGDGGRARMATPRGVEATRRVGRLHSRDYDAAHAHGRGW